jgi:hypothetical protein
LFWLVKGSRYWRGQRKASCEERRISEYVLPCGFSHMFTVFLFSDPEFGVQFCRPITSVQSPPATSKICDFTYYIANNLIGNRNELTHYVLRYRSRGRRGMSTRFLSPTNAKRPVQRSHVATYLSVAPRIPSIQPPATRNPFVVWVLPRMTCHVRS